MKYRLSALLLVLSPLLSACSPDPAPVEPVATQVGGTDAASADAATTATADANSGEAQPFDSAPTASDASNTPVVPAGPPQGPAPVAGVDYTVIANGQPYAPLNGQVEVVEVFGYTCGGCAQFEPVVQAWKKRQPADVRFTPVPAAFGGYWVPYARAFLAAEILGLQERTHEDMFRAVHLERSLPVQGVTPEQFGAFYAKYGVEAKAFIDAYQSFGLEARLNRAKQFAMRSGVQSTPSLVVNGMYRVEVGQEGGYDKLLNTVDHLVAQQRGAGAAAGGQ